MIRKTIEQLPDEVFLHKSIREIQTTMMDHNASELDRQKARAFADLACVSRRFINLGIAFEEFLSQPGIEMISAAMYALQWKDIYYQTVYEREQAREQGYWKRLWLALLGRL